MIRNTVAEVVPDGADRELGHALAVLGWSVEGDAVVTLAWGVGATTTLLAGLLSVAPVGAVVPGVVLVAGLVAGYVIRTLPVRLAEARRTRAVGAAPDLIALAVLRARVDPAPERAAAFAADHARDPLAASLSEHVTRSRDTPGTGWQAFGAEWRDWDPGIGRSVDLLAAAFEAPEGQRERLLDRALTAALDGTRERVAAFAAAVQGPTTAIYAFGVVLPLALVATLPAARSAGLRVSLSVMVAVYDLGLPIGLLIVAAWLLGRQPAAFPAAAVPRSHPDVPDRRAVRLLLGPGASLLAWLVAPRLFPAWSRWVLAPALGIGIAAVVYLRPVVRIRRQVTAVEASLPDALAVAGQRLSREAAPETTVATVGRELDGPAAERFAEAARVGRQLGVDVETAFLGPDGAFANLPSPRARAAVSLLALAGREGAHGGRVLIELSDHLDDLLAVERDARRQLSTTVGTLRNTACCFAPLIGGVTVALAGRLDGLDGGEITAVPAAEIGIAVGVYVVLLAAVLGGLAAALDGGVDRVRVGYRAATAVCAAAVVFPVAVRGAGLLV